MVQINWSGRNIDYNECTRILTNVRPRWGHAGRPGRNVWSQLRKRIYSFKQCGWSMLHASQLFIRKEHISFSFPLAAAWAQIAIQIAQLFYSTYVFGHVSCCSVAKSQTLTIIGANRSYWTGVTTIVAASGRAGTQAGSRRRLTSAGSMTFCHRRRRQQTIIFLAATDGKWKSFRVSMTFIRNIVDSIHTFVYWTIVWRRRTARGEKSN